MIDREFFYEIWITLSRNKFRSLLTCFGVFWGILVLILLLGLCEGLRNGVKATIDGIATNSCFYSVNNTGKPYLGFNMGRSWYMHTSDIENIKNNVKEIEYISPMLISREGDSNIKYKSLSGSFLVKGVYPNYFNIEKPILIKGRLLNYIDNKDQRKVCVIGKSVANILLGDIENSIGKYLNVEGVYYQVVGIIGSKSSLYIAGNPNEGITVPYNTLQQIKSVNNGFKYLCVTIKEEYRGSEPFTQVKDIIKKNNKISPSDEQAIVMVNIAQEFERYQNIYKAIMVLTWIIGLGTLLSGIIGINNILLVTVKEREREIGIRRALGAKPLDILAQILLESFTMSCFSGIVGLIIGVDLLFFIDYILSFNVDETFFLKSIIINFNTAIYVLLFLMSCGIISGFLPALKGLLVKPIDAIQCE